MRQFGAKSRSDLLQIRARLFRTRSILDDRVISVFGTENPNAFSDLMLCIRCIVAGLLMNPAAQLLLTF
jgi:hypothetical protein